jgi:lipopolysaccharide export system ATP-binding protein
VSVERLEASGLSKRYGARWVVENVSFHVAPGEVVGLLGPNGAGKTTSFNMVVGLVRPDTGKVLLEGRDVGGLPIHQRARAGLGYLPQEASVFRALSVKENLLAALELEGSVPKAERGQRADQALEELGLTKVAHARGDTLSGGERRRTEIARALLAKPRYFLFDEPFAGVDPINVAELQQEIARLKARGLGVLMTDHNVRDTLAICDRAYILSEGHILEEGTPAQLAASARARSVYLGENFKLS